MTSPTPPEVDTRELSVVADLADYWQVVIPGDAAQQRVPELPDTLEPEARAALVDLLAAGSDVVAQADEAGIALIAGAVVLLEADAPPLVALLSVAIVDSTDLATAPNELGLLAGEGNDAVDPVLAFPLPVDQLAQRILASAPIDERRTRTVLELAQVDGGGEVPRQRLWLAVQDAERYDDDGVTLLVTALTPCASEPEMISAVLTPAVAGVRLTTEPEAALPA